MSIQITIIITYMQKPEHLSSICEEYSLAANFIHFTEPSQECSAELQLIRSTKNTNQAIPYYEWGVA